MQNIIEQWNRAALRYTEEQENSEFSESNKRVVQHRFQCLNGEKLLDIVSIFYAQPMQMKYTAKADGARVARRVVEGNFSTRFSLY